MQFTYSSKRWRGQPCQVELELSVPAGQTARTAEPGSLESFLCERYVLYTLSGRQQLLKARVHHTPYPLLDAQVTECTQSLTDAIGCPVGQVEHVVFSPGVDVNVYSLQQTSAMPSGEKHERANQSS
jgi:uncharacterized protein YqjF (DUF2071 family)